MHYKGDFIEDKINKCNWTVDKIEKNLIFVNATIRIRDTKSKQGVEYDDLLIWDDDNSAPCIFLWSDGNWSCCCNRALLFDRAIGVEKRLEEYNCDDDSQFEVQILNPMGDSVIYDEFDGTK